MVIKQLPAFEGGACFAEVRPFKREGEGCLEGSLHHLSADRSDLQQPRFHHHDAVDLVGLTRELKLSQSALVDPEQYFHCSHVVSGLLSTCLTSDQTFGF